MKKWIFSLLFLIFISNAWSQSDRDIRQTKRLMKYEVYFSEHGYEMLETYSRGDIRGTWFAKGDLQILIAWESGWLLNSSVHIHEIVITPAKQSRYLTIKTKYGKEYFLYYLNPQTYAATRSEAEKKGVYLSSLHLEILDIKGFARYSDDIKNLVTFFKKGP